MVYKYSTYGSHTVNWEMNVFSIPDYIMKKNRFRLDVEIFFPVKSNMHVKWAATGNRY